MLAEKVFPITTIRPPLDFYELARKKHRFPSPKVRFCTTELKMLPSRDHVWKLRDAGAKVVMLTGVRAAESPARAALPEREFADWYYGLPVWRPLLKWTIDDVWAIHARHGIEPNPLYGMGMTRVGCFPCIMSRKKEIARVATLFPERVASLSKFETQWAEAQPDKPFHSFFARDKVPRRYRSIPIVTKDGRKMQVASMEDVARWALDGEEIDKARAVQAGRQALFEFDTTEDDAPVCASTYGACE
jgi:3'-phosphoadenosine 5'-phosphosulfate sulfotransferase (PAPS reductase)/FAD synthetase